SLLDQCPASTRGHQRLAPEVAKSPVAPHSIDYAIERTLLAHGFERGSRGVEDLRVLEVRDPGNVEPPLSRPGAAAAEGVPALAHRRRRHEAELHDASALEGDKGGEHRDAA